jgi:KTSC domain
MFWGAERPKEVTLMNISAVESTTLSTIGYDDAQQLLQLEFCSGPIYQYFDVPAAVHADLLLASSKGTYFNQMIRRRFAYARVPETQTGACCLTLVSESSR